MKHLLAICLSVMILTPLFTLNGMYDALFSGTIPHLEGSILISALGALFVVGLVSAPVASICQYLVEHKWSARWFVEPALLFTVLVVYLLPLCALLRTPPVLFGSILIGLSLPTLIYYLLIRAISIREYI